MAIYRSDELFAVIPLEQAVFKLGFLRLRILQLFYPNEMGVNDVLSSEPIHQYRDQIVKALSAQLPFYWFIRFHGIFDDSVKNVLGCSSAIGHSHYSKYVDVSGGFEAFWAKYSSKFRKDIEKKYRKAGDIGLVRFVAQTNRAQLEEAFTQFLDVEDSGWKGRSGTSIKRQPKRLAMYTELMKLYGDRHMCQINLLYIGDTIAAAHFGIKVKDRLYLLKIGFMEEFSSVSPGFLLLYRLLQEPFETSGVNQISFVTGVDWIDRWKPNLENAGLFYLSSGTFYSGWLSKALNHRLMLKEQKPTI